MLASGAAEPLALTGEPFGQGRGILRAAEVIRGIGFTKIQGLTEAIKTADCLIALDCCAPRLS